MAEINAEQRAKVKRVYRMFESLPPPAKDTPHAPRKVSVVSAYHDLVEHRPNSNTYRHDLGDLFEDWLDAYLSYLDWGDHEQT